MQRQINLQSQIVAARNGSFSMERAETKGKALLDRLAVLPNTWPASDQIAYAQRKIQSHMRCGEPGMVDHYESLVEMIEDSAKRNAA